MSRHRKEGPTDPHDVRIQRALRGNCPQCGGAPHSDDHHEAVVSYGKAWHAWKIHDAEDRLGRSTVVDSANRKEQKKWERDGKAPLLPLQWSRIERRNCNDCDDKFDTRSDFKVITDKLGDCIIDVTESQTYRCGPCRLEKDAEAHEEEARRLRRKATEIRDKQRRT